MQRIIIALLVSVFAIQTIGCTTPTKEIGGITYRDYGLFNENECKNPKVLYEPNWWNVFWGVVLCETIIAPIYVFGYHMMEPVGLKPAVPGQVQ